MLERNYYTLIGSLPTLPSAFDKAERVPISRLKLIERLKMLEPEDAKLLEIMINFLVWERQPIELTDDRVLRHYDQFMLRVENRVAREFIEFTMTLRTILSGLRRRRLHQDPPLGIQPWAEQIARHWEHPHFRLEGRLPWIVRLEELLSSDDPMQVEWYRLNLVWEHLKKLSEQHFFTFEAVLIYLKRWELVDRWTQRDARKGRHRFDRLVKHAMGEYAELFSD
jgi:hypothetical protein